MPGPPPSSLDRDRDEAGLDALLALLAVSLHDPDAATVRYVNGISDAKGLPARLEEKDGNAVLSGHDGGVRQEPPGRGDDARDSSKRADELRS